MVTNTGIAAVAGHDLQHRVRLGPLLRVRGEDFPYGVAAHLQRPRDRATGGQHHVVDGFPQPLHKPLSELLEGATVEWSDDDRRCQSVSQLTFRSTSSM